MYGESKLLRSCGDFFKNWFKKNCRILENDTIVQRRSATLKAFDAVALQWLSLRFQIRRTFASEFAIVWAVLMGQTNCVFPTRTDL